jgi:prepilin-type N-terminal cleavage/methylation domain-containing protein
MNPIPAPAMQPRLRGGGFTLLELLVVIVIVAIITALALPSFMASIRSRHDADLVSKLAQDIAWARGDAIAGWTVKLTLAADGSWSVTDNAPGATSAALAEHSMSAAQLQADAPGATCAVSDCSGSASSSCAATMTFDALGMVSGAPAGVLSYSTGSMSYSMQVFSSGVVVENPCHAS